MNQLPENLKYTAAHHWLKLEDDIARVGITDFAQQELGDLVYVDLPKLGRELNINEPCAVLESVKTASDLASPVSGKIVAINEQLNDSPENINENPYDAWLFCIQLNNSAELETLISANNYQQLIND